MFKMLKSILISPVKSRFYCILTSPNLLFLILNHALNKRFIAYNSCRFEAILNVFCYMLNQIQNGHFYLYLELYRFCLMSGCFFFFFFLGGGGLRKTPFILKSGPKSGEQLSTLCLCHEMIILRVRTPPKHTRTSFGVCIYP
ncbi:Nonribosomal peptide synthetase 2 [Labeo rohita]|uniref:Nonribosomal peptide synthetase 2 n=1 Tax=Labeo rohita TaxID=84645 RepID=A0ABQ8LWS9_LABRO|nr:Nonribosomal peptide synthetase 2 [Labeo rohita]